MNVFVFDIETVPDVDGARRLWQLEGLDDQAVADVMYNKRSQETGGTSDFHRHYLHRVVAISAVLRSGSNLNVWSLGDEQSSEAELLGRFFDGFPSISRALTIGVFLLYSKSSPN